MANVLAHFIPGHVGEEGPPTQLLIIRGVHRLRNITYYADFVTLTKKPASKLTIFAYEVLYKKT